ncbi:MAG TPA: SRPBCC family protein [Bacteroidia bacterium]
METPKITLITVEAVVHAPVEKVWNCWTSPEHIIKWNQASDDWHTPRATNDLRVGGKFLSRMEAKDGSFGFDFEGTYSAVKPNELIEYSIIGGRSVKIIFSREGNNTRVTETFETEPTHTLEQQRAGWQAIMNNFKKHVESLS